MKDGIDNMKKFSDVLLEATEISARQRTDIKSGYSAIDYGENGSIFRKGNLIMLASRPGMGKTTLATQIAVNAANHGSTILFLSSEYSACALVRERRAILTGSGDIIAFQSTLPV